MIYPQSAVEHDKAARLLSERIKADVHKPLETIIEEARLAALHSYRMLDPAAVEGLSRLSREAAVSLAASKAAVSFVDASRVWFGGAFGFTRTDAPRENSYCDAVVRSAAPLLVPDGLADPRFWRHELVHGTPGLRCYAGAPLIDRGGYTLGTVAVFSVTPAAFSASILQDLSALATLVRDFLAESRGTDLPAAVTVEPVPVRLVQGWLGVKTLSTDEGKAGTLAGVVVLSVARGSPAEKAGIRPTDILHRIGDHALFVASDVAAAMAGRALGSVVPVRFRRSGEWHQVNIGIRAKRRRIMGR